MNIFDRNNKVVKDIVREIKKEEVEPVKTPVEEKVEVIPVEKVEEKPAETTEIVVKEPKKEKPVETVKEEKFHKYKVKYNGHKYQIIAKSQEEARTKLEKFFRNKITEPKKELSEQDKQIIIKVKDIFNAIAGEITRIVTVAHPETVNNSYDRWVAVLTEELGEIVHEINDEHEGKEPTKNTYVECVQLAAATILLAKKFANEHPEIFSVEDKIKGE